MAERYNFDALAVQQGVAFGLLGGTAAGLLTDNLGYWMTLGALTGFTLAFGRNAHRADDDSDDEESFFS